MSTKQTRANWGRIIADALKLSGKRGMPDELIVDCHPGLLINLGGWDGCPDGLKDGNRLPIRGDVYQAEWGEAWTHDDGSEWCRLHLYRTEGVWRMGE